MGRYSKVRAFIFVVLCGFIPYGWGVLIDGESADRSAGWWVVFLSGLLVIAVGGIVVESLYRKRLLGHLEDEVSAMEKAAGV
jgi:hypothetical protein